LSVLLTATALLLAQAPAQATLRTVSASILDDAGRPVRGLVPDEVVVLENGVARDVARVEPDERPLEVLVLLDSSQVFETEFRLRLVGAVEDLLTRLPEGARFSIWTTGDRPTRRYGPGTEVPAALRELRRVIPQGGNTMLDALVEASRELRRPEGSRAAVVAISSSSVEFSSRDRRQVAEQARGLADVFHVVYVREGSPDVQTEAEYGYVFSRLTEESGGMYEAPLSVMGAPSALRRIGDDLASQYRITYATLEGAESRKLEVQVARPGVVVRVVNPRSDD